MEVRFFSEDADLCFVLHLSDGSDQHFPELGTSLVPMDVQHDGTRRSREERFSLHGHLWVYLLPRASGSSNAGSFHRQNAKSLQVKHFGRTSLADMHVYSVRKSLIYFFRLVIQFYAHLTVILIDPIK